MSWYPELYEGTLKMESFSHVSIIFWSDLYRNCTNLFPFYETATPPSPGGPGYPYSRSLYITHSDAPHSVGLLWKSDQPVAETSTCQHPTLTTDMPHGGIRTHILNRWAAADLRLRPRGHWDRLNGTNIKSNYHLNPYPANVENMVSSYQC